MVHQTANAACKRAFLHYLDHVVAKLPEGDSRRSVLVTSGGCAAGKGYALAQTKIGKQSQQQAGAVWDAAGEQNATENSWILDECKKRGLKATFAFIHANPKDSWENPDRGVVQRANDKGRMVDAQLFADSYAVGAQNFHAFHQKHQHNPDADFIILDNSQGAEPKILDRVPEDALKVNVDELYRHSASKLTELESKLRPAVVRGGMVGHRIWGAPGGGQSQEAQPEPKAEKLAHRSAPSVTPEPQRKPPHPDEIAKSTVEHKFHTGVTLNRMPDGSTWVVKARTAGKGPANEEAAAGLAPLAGVNVPAVHNLKLSDGRSVSAVHPVDGFKSFAPLSVEEGRAAMAKVPKAEVDKHALFDYLIGGGDPNTGNYGFDKNGRFVAIDKENSLNHNGLGNSGGFEAPFFLGLAQPEGKHKLDYQFDQQHVAAMAAAGAKMAEKLDSMGRSQDARGVRHRTAVLQSLGSKGGPITAEDIDRAGRQAGEAKAPGFGSMIRSLFGG